MSDPSDVYRRAWNSALSTLAIREHSAAELAQKLRRRGYAEDIVRRVIADCRERSYLDDLRAGRELIAGLQRRGFGIRRMRSEFQRRGLCGEASEFNFPTAEEESAVALRVALKKWQNLQRERGPGTRRVRLVRFLRSRGFSEAVLSDVLKSIEVENAL